jgi:hypothetical protein
MRRIKEDEVARVDAANTYTHGRVTEILNIKISLPERKEEEDACVSACMEERQRV